MKTIIANGQSVSLPPEIIQIILSYIDPIDYFNACLVCKEWLRYMDSSIVGRSWQRLMFKDMDFGQHVELRYLKKAMHIVAHNATLLMEFSTIDLIPKLLRCYSNVSLDLFERSDNLNSTCRTLLDQMSVSKSIFSNMNLSRYKEKKLIPLYGFSVTLFCELLESIITNESFQGNGMEISFYEDFDSVHIDNKNVGVSFDLCRKILDKTLLNFDEKYMEEDLFTFSSFEKINTLIQLLLMTDSPEFVLFISKADHYNLLEFSMNHYIDLPLCDEDKLAIYKRLNANPDFIIERISPVPEAGTDECLLKVRRYLNPQEKLFEHLLFDAEPIASCPTNLELTCGDYFLPYVKVKLLTERSRKELLSQFIEYLRKASTGDSMCLEALKMLSTAQLNQELLNELMSLFTNEKIASAFYGINTQYILDIWFLIEDFFEKRLIDYERRFDMLYRIYKNVKFDEMSAETFCQLVKVGENSTYFEGFLDNFAIFTSCHQTFSAFNRLFVLVKIIYKVGLDRRFNDWLSKSGKNVLKNLFHGFVLSEYGPKNLIQYDPFMYHVLSCFFDHNCKDRGLLTFPLNFDVANISRYFTVEFLNSQTISKLHFFCGVEERRQFFSRSAFESLVVRELGALDFSFKVSKAFLQVMAQSIKIDFIDEAFMLSVTDSAQNFMPLQHLYFYKFLLDCYYRNLVILHKDKVYLTIKKQLAELRSSMASDPILIAAIRPVELELATVLAPQDDMVAYQSSALASYNGLFSPNEEEGGQLMVRGMDLSC